MGVFFIGNIKELTVILPPLAIWAGGKQTTSKCCLLTTGEVPRQARKHKRPTASRWERVPEAKLLSDIIAKLTKQDTNTNSRQ